MKDETIFKYLSNEATEAEVAELFEWIEQSEKNKNRFIKIKGAWAFNIDKSSNISYNKNLLFKIAAIFLISLAVGSFIFIEGVFEQRVSTKTDKTENVVLEIELFTQKTLEQKDMTSIVDRNGDTIATQNKNEITFLRSQNPQDSIVYHKLIVPRGKTFKIVFSDGSKAHLNSGSMIRFPSQFPEKGIRSVELDGEAFFEISKDSMRSFVVGTHGIDVSVLGTKFNLEAYSSENIIKTALIEGSVKLSSNLDNANTRILEPNDLGNFDFQNDGFSVETVDTTKYMSWIHGVITFNNQSFESIVSKLERTYGINIVVNYDILKNQKFTGSFDKNKNSIESILEIIRIDTDFRFESSNNLITIDEPIY